MELPRVRSALLAATATLGLVGALTACAPPGGGDATPTARPDSPSVSGVPVSGTPSSGATASATPLAADGAPAAAASVTCAYPKSGEPARPVDPPETRAPASGTAAVTLSFAAGDVVVTMDRAKAPCTVNSFESLAGQGFYTGTRCHRLADNGLFMLQCGDPTGTGTGGPGYRFADEVDPASVYSAGTVAMANSGPDTNGSQFFLVYQDSKLPAAYTIFGHLDPASTAVVSKMAAEGQDGSYGDGTGRPNNPAAITAVRSG